MKTFYDSPTTITEEKNKNVKIKTIKKLKPPAIPELPTPYQPKQRRM